VKTSAVTSIGQPVVNVSRQQDNNTGAVYGPAWKTSQKWARGFIQLFD